MEYGCDQEIDPRKPDICLIRYLEVLALLVPYEIWGNGPIVDINTETQTKLFKEMSFDKRSRPSLILYQKAHLIKDFKIEAEHSY